MPQEALLEDTPAILALFFGECGLAGNSTLKQAGEQERYRLSVAGAGVDRAEQASEVFHYMRWRVRADISRCL
jgi:hypothetical protein